MSAGLELPERVFGHGFVHFKGEKMSKSLGTIVDPLEAASKFGPGPAAPLPRARVRLRPGRRLLVGAVRGALQLGPRQQPRATSSAASRRWPTSTAAGGCRVPAATPGRLADAAAAALAAYRASMDAFALQDGMAAAFAIIDAANGFIAETEPWKLAKDEANAPRVAQILYEVAEALRIAAILLLPAMPASAAEILRRVGAPKSGAGHRLDDAAWNAAGDLVTIKADAMWPRIGEAKKK